MNSMENCPWMIYSKYERSGKVPSNIELLDNIIWEDWPTKTNMSIQRQLPPPHAFLIRSVHTVYGRMNEADKEEFRWRYIMEIHLGQKIFHQAPLCGLHDGIRLIEAHKFGRPQQPGYFPQDCPLIIPSMMTVRVRLIGKSFTLLSSLKFMVVLNGELTRSVQ